MTTAIPISTPHDTPPSGASRIARVAFWLALIVGVAIRFRQFFFGRSLWLDEAMLGIHLLGKSGADFLHRLQEPFQVAPPGFLVVAAWMARWFPGDVEWKLRAFPLVCGVASLVALAFFCRRSLSAPAAALATAFAAISAPLIYFATECKQYAADGLAAAVMIALITSALRNRLSPLRAVALAASGSLLVWFSHAVVFILAAAAAVLLADIIRSRRLRELTILLPVFAAWGISFAAFYLTAIRPNATDPALLGFHQGSFMPFPPRSLADLRWLLQAIFGMLIEPAGFSAPVLAALMVICGLAWSDRFSRMEKWFLLSPGLLALAASALHRYPFFERFLVFLAPSLIVLVAEGCCQCARLAGRSRLGWLPAALLLLQPLGNAAQRFLHPQEKEEIRPVLAHLTSHSRAGDTILVHHQARWTFEFYRPLLALPALDTIRAPGTTATGANFAQVAALRGNRRVWMLFAHTDPADVREIVAYATAMGVKLESCEALGASLWLFDLGDSVRAQAR